MTLIQWLPIGAYVLAIVSGTSFAVALLQNRRINNRKKSLRKSLSDVEVLQNSSSHQKGKSVYDRIISFMQDRSRRLRLRGGSTNQTRSILAIGTKKFDRIIGKTGLGSSITKAGFCDARIRLSIGAFLGGAFVGAIFSTELMLVLALVGGAFGWSSTLKALEHTKRQRKTSLEQHLSEMIEVVALGLRSGLTFDRSFALYHRYFPTTLGKESASAQQQWSIGLSSREDALRSLANTYDSTLFNRVVENIIRSLRFGSSLADSLEASAIESRAIYKANMEEKVAKAPVKMLIPTAALILPAMLLLVLGPVLLDMMQGF